MTNKVRTIEDLKEEARRDISNTKTGTLIKMMADPAHDYLSSIIESELNIRFADIDRRHFEGNENDEYWADKSRRGEA